MSTKFASSTSLTPLRVTLLNGGYTPRPRDFPCKAAACLRLQLALAPPLGQLFPHSTARPGLAWPMTL